VDHESTSPPIHTPLYISILHPAAARCIRCLRAAAAMATVPLGARDWLTLKPNRRRRHPCLQDAITTALSERCQQASDGGECGTLQRKVD